MKERELLWRAERKALTVPELTAIAKRWFDELDDSDAAKASLRKAQKLSLKSGPDNALLYQSEIAAAWVHLGDREAARQAIEAYLALPEDALPSELCFRAGLTHFLGNVERSWQYLQSAEAKADCSDHWCLNLHRGSPLFPVRERLWLCG